MRFPSDSPAWAVGGSHRQSRTASRMASAQPTAAQWSTQQWSVQLGLRFRALPPDDVVPPTVCLVVAEVHKSSLYKPGTRLTMLWMNNVSQYHLMQVHLCSVPFFKAPDLWSLKRSKAQTSCCVLEAVSSFTYLATACIHNDLSSICHYAVWENLTLLMLIYLTAEMHKKYWNSVCLGMFIH